MMRLLRLLRPVALVGVLLWLGLSSGGVRGVVGWFVIAWVLWRAAPGLWFDLRRFGRFLRTFKLRRSKPNFTV